MREGVAIYEFHDPWEARLARDALDDAGFEAWLEPAEREHAQLEEVQQRYRLCVPAEDADEARSALTEPLMELPEVEEEPTVGRRPAWVPVVAALVLVSFVITYAVQYDFLWPWILLTAFVGFLVWRAVGPRHP
ncbi:MAG: putative signal transducing protein [Actinomycetota bacterium]